MPGVKFFVYIFIISLLSQLPAKKYIYVFYIDIHIHTHIYTHISISMQACMCFRVDFGCIAKPQLVKVPVHPRQSQPLLVPVRGGWAARTG